MNLSITLDEVEESFTKATFVDLTTDIFYDDDDQARWRYWLLPLAFFEKLISNYLLNFTETARYQSERERESEIWYIYYIFWWSQHVTKLPLYPTEVGLLSSINHKSLGVVELAENKRINFRLFLTFIQGRPFAG